MTNYKKIYKDTISLIKKIVKDNDIVVKKYIDQEINKIKQSIKNSDSGYLENLDKSKKENPINKYLILIIVLLVIESISNGLIHYFKSDKPIIIKQTVSREIRPMVIQQYPFDTKGFKLIFNEIRGRQVCMGYRRDFINGSEFYTKCTNIKKRTIKK